MEPPVPVKPTRCPNRLNHVSVVWFWVTITGVFYLGLGHVLPVLYIEYSTTWLLCHHIICYFILVQMVLNWTFIKLIYSPFKPDDHMQYITDHVDEIANGGFEINLNHLKNAGENGTFSVPMVSVKSAVDKKTTWDKDTMYIISLPPEEIGTGLMGDDRRRIVYPYWSWKPCLICQCQRPPRAHHCPLCNTCVLKRDHHCFFTGSCIGLRNQRHFVVFSFWSSVATTYCVLHSIVYLFTDFLVRNTLWDTLLPVTFMRWLGGYISILDTVMVAFLYSLLWFWVTSLAFFAEQVKVVRKGVTSFEEDNRIKIMSSSSVEDNLKGVFGEYWYLNFLFPLHSVFPNGDDGVEWRYIKA